MTIETKVNGYKDPQQFEAALIAAGVSFLGTASAHGSVNFNVVVSESAIDSATVTNCHNGVGTWMLTADGIDGSVDITVSGADANCTWFIYLNGVEIASEADTVSPYEVTLLSPVVAGTYTVLAVAIDGTKTGKIEMEVS